MNICALDNIELLSMLYFEEWNLSSPFAARHGKGHGEQQQLGSFS